MESRCIFTDVVSKISHEMKSFMKNYLKFMKYMINEGHKTKLDDQIEAVAVMCNRWMRVPVLEAVIDSLKELQAIKRKRNDK